MSFDFYNARGQDLSKAWHEVGHYLTARDCGLAVTVMSIDPALAKRECSDRSGGFCSIPSLPSAPLFDQVSVYRAGIVASDMAGFPYNDGGSGDFDQEKSLIDHLRGDEQRAMIARASRRAEKILRDNWTEAQQLVARLFAERTIRFDSPTAVRAIPWAERRAAMDAKHGAAVVDAELLRLGYTHLVSPAAPLVQVRRELLPRMMRSASVNTFNATDRSFESVWSTGATVRRLDENDQPYDEELDMTSSAVDLSRLNAGAPLLAQHDASSLAGVIGNVISARVENGVGYARVRLSKRKDLDGLAQDVADGVIHHLSVGYRIDKAERKMRAGGVPLLRATRWTPYELSLVAIPADRFATVRKDAPKFEALVAA